MSINFNESDKLSQRDLLIVMDSFVETNGLVGHAIRSTNDFYKTGIRQIMTEGFDIRKIMNNRRMATEEDRKIRTIDFAIKFTSVQIARPQKLNPQTGVEEILLPNEAMLTDKMYSGTLNVGFTVTAKAQLHTGEVIQREESVASMRIAKIPIIKGSDLCHTTTMTTEALRQCGEDPTDIGGYFITKNEYSIDSVESTTFNQLKAYINEGYGKSRIRGDFLSKPGDSWQNTDMCIIVFNTDNTLTVEVSRDKLMDVSIPFYLLFRAMGWSNDRELLDWIVYDYEGDSNKGVLNHIVNAMNAKYGKINYRGIYKQHEALREIMRLIPSDKFKYLDLEEHPENETNAMNEVMNTIDLHLLPHIGASADYRVEKMRFLALMIRKVLMIYLGYIPETDRDSYRIKRIHAPGDNIAKAFKHIFNKSVAMPIKKHGTKVFGNTPFSQVGLANFVKTAISVDEFERLMVQIIVSGNRSTLRVRQKTITNKLMAQQVHRKNGLCVTSTLRQVTAGSSENAKQSARADQMRRVHGSALGYICPAHSPPEGEKVGVNKQMSIFATIAPASSSEVLKKTLLADPLIIDGGALTPIEINRSNYATVYVNGHLLGYTLHSNNLVTKYRKQRRESLINQYTTIYWDNMQNEVLFFVDIGRMVRPLVIVYNTQRDPEMFDVASSDSHSASARGGKSTKKSKSGGTAKPKFEQFIAITPSDITAILSNNKTIMDLVTEGKVEFISPEEQQNCLICPSLDELRESRFNDLKEYTHCDVPQALVGITALTAPFGNHNQAPRVTYQTSQSKQTCGYYAGNWPYRIDKETFLQYINEMPLVRTLVNKYIYPNGNNLMVAMMCYYGENQEDSILFNKASVERGMFTGCKFDFEKTELDAKETVGEVDISNTKKNVNYGKLHNGIVPPGTILTYNDVMISKILTVTEQPGKTTQIDRSIIYKEKENAEVTRVITTKNEDGAPIIKVAYRKQRPLSVGDKMCLSAAHEVYALIDGVGTWVPIMQLATSSNYLVATLGANGVEYHAVDKFYSYHNTEIYCCDLFEVSADHRMYVRDVACAVCGLQEECVANGGNCVMMSIGAPRLVQYKYLKNKKYSVISCGELDGVSGNDEPVFDMSPDSGNIKMCKGSVYCIEVPNHIFYTRLRGGVGHWTGNSSRAGQKGICACLLPEADMPFTNEGIRPDLIFNPHGLPSRMTASQLIEMLVSNVCAVKGVHYDGTIFNEVDIETFADQMEACGMNRYGYERLINGFTGEFIDTMIFFGPTYYQRLQKFVKDNEYSVSQASVDAVTHQPLDGMSASGGLRIGEMERDVILSHGAISMLFQKFWGHSDGNIHYYCRCGREAIVNFTDNIYRCKVCRDMSNINAYYSTYTSSLFVNEMRTCCVGVNVHPAPYNCDIDDTEDGAYSLIEEYGEETLRRLYAQGDELAADADVDNE